MGGIEDHTGLDDQVRSSPDDEERSDPKKLIAPGSEKSEMDDKIMLGGYQEQYRDCNLPSVQNNNINNAENRILQTPNSRTRRVMKTTGHKEVQFSNSRGVSEAGYKDLLGLSLGQNLSALEWGSTVK